MSKHICIAVVVCLVSLSAAGQGAAQWKGDTDFVASTMQHHRMGIQMTTMCATKATHQELKDLCRQMTSEQQKDNDEMKQISAKGSQGAHEEAAAHPSDPEHQQMHQMSSAAMSSLQGKTGADFEREFLKQMSMHHEMAVAKANTCKTSASSDKLKELCARMVDMQTREREQMMSWSQQWYGQTK